MNLCPADGSISANNSACVDRSAGILPAVAWASRPRVVRVPKAAGAAALLFGSLLPSLPVPPYPTVENGTRVGACRRTESFFSRSSSGC